MKPCNFPERKRQRQLGALARLISSKRDDDCVRREILILQERTQKNLRDVRTKKDRSATARFSRAA